VSSPKTQPPTPAKRSGAVLDAAPKVPAGVRAGVRERARSLRERLLIVWVPGLSWAIARTGRAGLAGMALMAASGVFFVSTVQQVAGEVRELRVDLETAQARAAAEPSAADTADSPESARTLPARVDMPQVLGVLLRQADDAQLSIETAKYEISTVKTGTLVLYRLSFPVDGPYVKVRQFLDGALTELPELAIDDLSITRKSIADQAVEAQLRMTIFTRGQP
jgi:hypothetical protein